MAKAPDITGMIRTRDEFGTAAVKLMRRINAIGYERALEEQIAKPAIQDPDWAAMIVALMTGREAVAKNPRRDLPTYACATCLDRGFRLRTDEDGVVWSDYCLCPTGRGLLEATRELARREQARRSRKRERRDEDPFAA